MSQKQCFFEPLTEVQLRTIYEEFNATKASLINDVKYLIEWLEKQPHLPNIKDEQWILNFLLRCKNSVERTKQHLELYFTSRATMSIFFKDREIIIPSALKLAKKMSAVPLPKATPDGKRVLLLRYCKNIEIDFTGENLIRSFQMVLEIILKQDPTTQMITVADLANLTLPLVGFFLPILKTIIFAWTKMFPFRHNKVYILNLPPFAESFIHLCISLLSKKLANRVEIWKKSPTELSTVIPPEVLPSCYGGTGGDVENIIDKWLELFMQSKDWLIADENVKADLKKKPSSNSDHIDTYGEYGIEGSFRKINLD